MREVIRPGIAIEVRQEADGWHGWTYRKIKGQWFTSGAITPRPTKEEARKATITLAK